MIQRIQSIFMFFAILSVAMIMYKAPVLTNGDQVMMLGDFMWAQIAAFITMFLIMCSMLQFKNRANQLLLNQFSKLSLSISFFIIFKLADDFFEKKIYCLLSVLTLEGIYFYNYTTPEFNVYITELPFWSLAIFFCWKSLKNNSYLNWTLFGVFAALGSLSHYLFMYLLISFSFINGIKCK